MKFKGKITNILPMQSGTGKASGKEWQKVEFVVEEGAQQYPDSVCIAAFNDKVEELVGVNVGDTVEVDFNCRCNEYNGRVYNSLNLHKIEKAGGQQPAQQPAPQPSHERQDNLFGSSGDDLPF